MKADFLPPDLLAALSKVFIDREAFNGNHPTVPSRLLRRDSLRQSPRETFEPEQVCELDS